MINEQRVEKQLEPVLGPERATLLTSLASGMDSTLADNPMVAAILAPHTFPAVAILYACALRLVNRALESPDTTDANRRAAEKTKLEMDQVVAAVLGPDPKETRDDSDAFLKNLIAELAR